ncbi:MAG: PH domain-containing protein, partial [Sarcina sp.]
MIYYKKNHWYSILINFYAIVKKFWAVIIAIVIPSLSFGFWESLGLFLVILIYCVVMWLNEFILINNEGIFYKRGILEIEEINLPLKSVSLIEFNRNVIHRILGLSKIKIDSISPNDRKFEIIMVLKKNKINEFQDFINKVENKINDTNLEVNDEKSYKISLKHLLILAMLRSNIIIGIGLIWSVVHMIGFLDNKLGNEFKNYLLYNIKYGLKSYTTMGVIIYILIVTIVSIAIILSFSVLGLILKYYKFKLDRKNNQLYIEHGFMVKKRYSINIEN